MKANARGIYTEEGGVRDEPHSGKIITLAVFFQ